MPRKLIKIKPFELSLVDIPANQRPFMVIKMKEQNVDKELQKLVEAFLSTDEESLEKAKLSEEDTNRIKGAMRILNRYKDAFPPEVTKAVGSLLGAYWGKPKKKSEEEDEDVDTIELTDEVIDVIAEKVGARFSKSTLATLKSMQEQVTDIMKALKTLKTLKDAISKLVPVKTEKSDSEEDAADEDADADTQDEADSDDDKSEETADEESTEEKTEKSESSDSDKDDTETEEDDVTPEQLKKMMKSAMEDGIKKLGK